MKKNIKQNKQKKKIVNFKIVFFSFLLLLPLFVFSQINTITGGFIALKNTELLGIKVDVHDNCRMVKNSSLTTDYFIPTKSVTEWNAFLAAVPSIPDLSVSNCIVCGAGYYLVGDICSCVGDGYFSPDEDNNRYPCLPGQYCSGCSAVGTCCPDGTYSAEPGGVDINSCTLCAAGTYGIGTCQASNTCALTPAGYYSAAGAASYSTCTSGTYSTAGSSSCTYCPPGTFASSSASSSCTDCALGTYTPYYRTTSCLSCPLGTYASTTGSSSCEDCPTGYTTSSTGSDSISDCSVSLLECGAGYYLLNDTCTCVGNGYFSPYDDDNRYICPIDSYCSGCAQAPSPCPEGYTTPNLGSDSSDDCTIPIAGCGAGYYLLNNVCTCVGNGYYSPVNNNNRYLCPAGQYCSGCSSAGTCCPDGTYLTTTGGTSSASCTSCPAGTSGVGTCQTSNTCDDCDPGSFSYSRAASCTSCSPGSYSSVSGATTCTSCACSTYTGSYGSTSCSTGYNGYNCSLGSTSATANACDSGYNSTISTCSYTCSAGYYDSNRDGVCELVSANYYSPAYDYKRYSCPAGSISPAGSDSLSDCVSNCAATTIDGYDVPAMDNGDSIQITMSTVANGSYCMATASCTNGTVSLYPMACNCNAGYYSTTNNSCAPCGLSSLYSPGGTIEACFPIPEGYYGTGGTSTTRTGYTQCNAFSDSCSYYCTSGSRYAVSSGYYVSSYGDTLDCRTASGQSQCYIGTYCISGRRYYCPDNMTHFIFGSTTISDCSCEALISSDPARPGYNLYSGYIDCDEDLSNGCEVYYNYSALAQKPNYEICCGDSYCSSANGENSSNCSDCGYCGDRLCSPEERISCPSDCLLLNPDCPWYNAICIADGDCPQSIDDPIVCCGGTCCPQYSCLQSIDGEYTCIASCP